MDNLDWIDDLLNRDEEEDVKYDASETAKAKEPMSHYYESSYVDSELNKAESAGANGGSECRNLMATTAETAQRVKQCGVVDGCLKVKQPITDMEYLDWINDLFDTDEEEDVKYDANKTAKPKEPMSHYYESSYVDSKVNKAESAGANGGSECRNLMATTAKTAQRVKQCGVEDGCLKVNAENRLEFLKTKREKATKIKYASNDEETQSINFEELGKSICDAIIQKLSINSHAEADVATLDGLKIPVAGNISKAVKNYDSESDSDVSFMATNAQQLLTQDVKIGVAVSNTSIQNDNENKRRLWEANKNDIQGTDLPSEIKSLSEANLYPIVKLLLQKAGVRELTPMQRKLLPLLLSERDIAVQGTKSDDFTTIILALICQHMHSENVAESGSIILIFIDSLERALNLNRRLGQLILNSSEAGISFVKDLFKPDVEQLPPGHVVIATGQGCFDLTKKKLHLRLLICDISGTYVEQNKSAYCINSAIKLYRNMRADKKIIIGELHNPVLDALIKLLNFKENYIAFDANMIKEEQNDIQFQLAGEDMPEPITIWKDLQLHPNLYTYFAKSSLSRLHKQAIPCILSGRDVLLSSEKHTGKTQSVLLGVCQQLLTNCKGIPSETVAAPVALFLAKNNLKLPDVYKQTKDLIKGTRLRAAIVLDAKSLQDHGANKHIIITSVHCLNHWLPLKQIILTNLKHLAFFEMHKHFKGGHTDRQIKQLVMNNSDVDVGNYQTIITTDNYYENLRLFLRTFCASFQNLPKPKNNNKVHIFIGNKIVANNVAETTGELTTEIQPQLIQNMTFPLQWLSPNKFQNSMLPVLQQGKDVLAVANARSGKTSSYLIYICAYLLRTNSFARANQKFRANVKNRMYFPKVLMLFATRRAATNAFRTLKALAKGTDLIFLLYNCYIASTASRHNIGSWTKPPYYDVLISTVEGFAKRLVSDQDKMKLSDISILIFDEAEDIFSAKSFRELTQSVRLPPPSKRQTIICCRTVTQSLYERIGNYVKNLTIVEYDETKIENNNVEFIHEVVNKIVDEVVNKVDKIRRDTKAVSNSEVISITHEIINGIVDEVNHAVENNKASFKRK